jgi:UDP-glucose 4-epimerase
MGETALVTGAAGFIGSHLVDQLLALGHRVIGVDNMALGRRENLASARKSKEFVFEGLDVNDYDAFVGFLREHNSVLTPTLSPGEREKGRVDSSKGPIETVWHMAANSDIPAGVTNPEVDLSRTFMTTFNVLKAMHALNIPQLCFASTSAIYGDLDTLLTEDTGPLFPISSYGAMKLGSEGMISAALERYLKRVWIFRFPNVVGSRATHGAIYDFMRKLKQNPNQLEVLGDGTQEKPYLHVSELIEAMLHLFDRTKDRLNYFNIGPDGSATTVRFIAETVVKEMSPRAKIRYTGGSKGWVGDVPKFTYSIDKVKAHGWRPKMTSNQAVEQAIRENVQQ